MNGNDKPKEPNLAITIMIAIAVAAVMTAVFGGFRGSGGGSAPSGGPSSSYQGNTYPVTDRQLDQIEAGAAMKQHNHDMLDQFNAQHGLKNGGK